MKLTLKEKKIIEEFKQRIKIIFPNDIDNIFIFGSKARGDADKESDIDILVVTFSDDWKKGDKIREIGYDIDQKIDYKLSIQVIPKSHIDYLKHNNFRFIKNVERDALIV